MQEGTLSLDDTISDHLSYYRQDNGERITIHHLISHQSGIKDFTANFEYRTKIALLPKDTDDFIQEYCSDDLLHEPGTLYAYSNAGYIILGRIIEKLTRKTYEQNLHQRIFEPLGMKNSGFDRNHYLLEKRASGYRRTPFGYENASYIDMGTTPGAAGALYSTVGDMFLWDRALYTDLLLDAKHRELMFTPNRDVPEVKAAGGRPQSNYGYGWQIFSRSHPITKKRSKYIQHGGAIPGFRAMEKRLVDDDAFVMVLCNQGDAPGGSPQVWNAVMALSWELSHIVTGQPYRLPGKPRPSQEQIMYDLTTKEGVDAAIQWFEEKGKKAAWGGSNLTLADKLIADGLVDEGLRFLDYDLKESGGKAWMLKKAARANLAAGRNERALELAKQGLELKPDDEDFAELVEESKRD